MNVVYFDIKANVKAETKVKAKKKSLKDLLQNSDIISLHVPFNSTTKHLINRSCF